jgi:hypothetical protein
MGHGETKQECLLHEALLDAFPDPKTLERIVQLGLDENLNEFSSASGDLNTRCWDLIVWARSCGRLDDLMRAAHGLNVNNAKLSQLAERWEFRTSTDASDPAKLPRDAVVSGKERYVVEALIGKGALGTLYRVRESTGGPRALKILSGFKECGDERAIERLQEDAKVGSRLGDQARSFVVDVKEVNVDRRFVGGVAFVVMDLLNGCQLDALVADEGRLSPERVLDLVKSLAIVLDDAAQRGIVHGDLKPSNLFLHKISDDVQVLKVMDFGIARSLGDSRFSELGRMVGTPLFAAPELWGASRPTPASDRWTLALLAFYALTGAFYWTATTFAALAVEVTSGATVRASERARALGVPLPSGFDAWFARCAHRTPSERFETGHAAYVALRDAVQWAADRSQLLAPVGPSVAEVAWMTREFALVPATVGQGLDERLASSQALRPGAVLEMLQAVAALLPQYRAYGARDPLMPSCIRYVPSKEGGEHVRLSHLNTSGLAAPGDGKTRTASIVFDMRVLGYIRPDLRSGVAVDDVWALARVAFFALTGVSHVPTDRVDEALRAAELETRPSERAYTQGRLECLPQGFDEWFARCSPHGPEPLRSLEEAVTAFAPLAQAPFMVAPSAEVPNVCPPSPWDTPRPVDVDPRIENVIAPDHPERFVHPSGAAQRVALGAMAVCLVVGAVLGAMNARPAPSTLTSRAPLTLMPSAGASAALDGGPRPASPPEPIDAWVYVDVEALADAPQDAPADLGARHRDGGRRRDVLSPRDRAWAPSPIEAIAVERAPVYPPNPYERFRPP